MEVGPGETELWARLTGTIAFPSRTEEYSRLGSRRSAAGTWLRALEAERRCASSARPGVGTDVGMIEVAPEWEPIAAVAEVAPAAAVPAATPPGPERASDTTKNATVATSAPRHIRLANGDALRGAGFSVINPSLGNRAIAVTYIKRSSRRTPGRGKLPKRAEGGGIPLQETVEPVGERTAS